MVTSQPSSLGSGTIRALESAWADIHDRHPDVMPNVVFITGTGAKGRGGALTLGHFTLSPNWQQRVDDDPARFHEVFIAAETLAQPASAILETLIHEAAHTVASTRGVKDVSRQNRYHNKRFRSICEEMGLSWEHLEYVPEDDGPGFVPHPDFDVSEPADIRTNPRYLTREARADSTIGFSDMTIADSTVEAYRETLANLDARIEVRSAPVRLAESRPRARRTACLWPLGPRDEVIEVGSEDEAVNLQGYVPEPGEIQRLGVQVYEGLMSRGLLTPHLVWIEGA